MYLVDPYRRDLHPWLRVLPYAYRQTDRNTAGPIEFDSVLAFTRELVELNGVIVCSMVLRVTSSQSRNPVVTDGRCQKNGFIAR